jgi:glycosyltransferase involved in cell wall biosynthesis
MSRDVRLTRQGKLMLQIEPVDVRYRERYTSSGDNRWGYNMPVTLAVVVPVYSGECYLDELATEVSKLRESWAADHAPLSLSRLIFVDDDAIDGSAKVIDGLAAHYPWVEAVHLSRNFGQHPATIAGILHTQEDWIVTMDEDLQHPPERIPDLLRKAVSNAADVVYGKPETSIHEAISRDLTSRGYKRLMGWLTGNKSIRDANSFRLIRGPIARGAAKAVAHDIYFDVSLSWFTKRIQTVVMPLKDQRYITTKKSGYDFRSLVAHGRRLLVSSQLKVLRLGALLGITLATSSVFVAVVVCLIWLFDREAIAARGWTSLILATIFLGGASLFMIGIALEYVSVLLTRSNGHPLFFEVDRSGDAGLIDYLSHQLTTASLPRLFSSETL